MEKAQTGQEPSGLLAGRPPRGVYRHRRSEQRQCLYRGTQFGYFRPHFVVEREATINIGCDRPRLGEGVYTLPDAAHILNLPQPRVRRWVNGYWQVLSSDRQHRQVLDLRIWGSSQDRAFNFYTLVEVYCVMAFREMGVSFLKIRQARDELSVRFKTPYPFASHELLCDGKRIMVALKNTGILSVLTLGAGGETAFQKIIEPFCHKLDFSNKTELAERFWPMGRDSSVVVDPRHGFGRPTLDGTNISTQVIYDLIRAGEDDDAICVLYELTEKQVRDARQFEERKAA